MLLTVLISKWHPTLPFLEVKSITGVGYGVKDKHDELLLIKPNTQTQKESNNIKNTLALRLSLSHEISENAIVFERKEFFDNFSKVKKTLEPFVSGKNICVRVKKLNSKNLKKAEEEHSTDHADKQSVPELERKIGGLIGEKINLKNPDIVIRFYICTDKVVVGFNPLKVDKTFLKKHQPTKRAFFHPATLEPKLARTLVNLTGLVPGQTLLDPFCGAGGILLEAGCVGLNVIGIEKDTDVFEGCKQNLDFYGIKNHQLFLQDATDPIPKHTNSIDAVATDAPFGKSTLLFGEKQLELYKKTLINLKKICKRKIVFSTNIDITELAESLGFQVESVEKVYVHKSLTRKIHILKYKTTNKTTSN